MQVVIQSSLSNVDVMPRSKPRDRNNPLKPFRCDQPKCGLGYYNKRHLTRHKKEKHGVFSPRQKTTAMPPQFSSYTYSVTKELVEHTNLPKDPQSLVKKEPAETYSYISDDTLDYWD